MRNDYKLYFKCNCGRPHCTGKEHVYANSADEAKERIEKSAKKKGWTLKVYEAECFSTKGEGKTWQI